MKSAPGANGLKVTTARLTDIFLEEAERGASCIELVTPGHYTRQIREALLYCQSSGLKTSSCIQFQRL